MNKPKLLIVNGNQFGYSAGHFFYCKYLTDTFDIEYICFDRNREKLNLDGVNVHYISFGGNRINRLFRFVLQSISICNKIKPQVLFIVQFNFCQIVALAGKARLKVLDIRTGSLALNPYIRKVGNRYSSFQTIFFDKVVILSESLRKKLKLTRKKSIVLPLGAEEFYKGCHEYSSINMLYIGTMHKRNLHQTVEGLGIAILRNPSFQSLIKYTIIAFGSNEEEIMLKKAIERFNLQSIIKFEGRKNYDELVPYFEKCNIGVAYTPITDFFNCQPVTKIYEYALSGLFTIATNTYENQLSINPINGILCEDNPESFAQAIEKVYAQLGSIQEKEIKESLKHHRWNLLVKDILEPFLK